MKFTGTILTCVLATLTTTNAYPTYIQCDFTVQAGKTSAGRNVMTTSGNIMGASPSSVTNLVSGQATWSSNGEQVTLSYGNGVAGKGFIHASAGALAGANKCSNMRLEWSSTPSGAIVWTAPSDGTTSVTISVATAGGYGAVKRQQITFTKSSTTTAAANGEMGKHFDGPIYGLLLILNIFALMLFNL